MSRMERPEDALERWDMLRELQKHYRNFPDFLRDGMELLGFSTSEIQEDIAHFMVHGPDSIMIQAQRGQAKTTVAALFSVWSLIHAPHYRILVVSAGGTQANEISTLIVRVILNMDVLECLRPDANAGDRTSVEHFDIHHSLKGVDKSPSVACVGIGANMQGKRADILLADDIESSKNAATATQRAQLMHLTLDFTSIAMGQDGKPGRIIWLGTPQSTDSIYNSLPSRGVTIRIWPGRYPTEEERKHYGEHLAPLIARRLAADPSLSTGGGPLGQHGRPVENIPGYLDEAVLQRKLLDQGEAYFQLQHMLNTRLMDALRYPLKAEKLIVMRLGQHRRVPIEITPGTTSASLRRFAQGGVTFSMSEPGSVSTQFVTLPALHMYIDPAPGGLNGDETGYAVSGSLNGNIFLFEVGGVPGGYDVPKMEALAEVAKKWRVNVVQIEKNMGYGAFKEVLQPILHRIHRDCSVEDDMVHGQKELRIAATLEPIVGRGSLIVNEDIVEEDWLSTQRYGAARAMTYSFFHQFLKLTRERGALQHDDRLDAVEGTCRYWQTLLGMDQNSERKKAEEAAYKEMTKDPLGYNRYKREEKFGSMLSSRLRRR